MWRGATRRRVHSRLLDLPIGHARLPNKMLRAVHPKRAPPDEPFAQVGHVQVKPAFLLAALGVEVVVPATDLEPPACRAANALVRGVNLLRSWSSSLFTRKTETVLMGTGVEDDSMIVVDSDADVSGSMASGLGEHGLVDREERVEHVYIGRE